MTGIDHDGKTASVEGELDKRIKLAEASFKTVLDADLHQDDKAGRILSAMAFLTTAAALIFNVAYSPSPSTTSLKQTLQMIFQSPISNAQQLSEAKSLLIGLTQPSQAIFGLNISVVALAIYIYFVLVGFALYLVALGPSLNKPSSVERSLLFFYNIADEKQEEWQNNLKNNKIECLQNQLLDNYINESFLIAQKVNDKVTLMSWGSIFFRIALLSFIFLMATLFLPNSGIFWVFFILGLISISTPFL